MLWRYLQFSSILTKVGDVLSKIEIEIIENRFRTKNFCSQEKPYVVRLFYTNQSVNEYNAKTYSHGEACVSKNEIIGAKNKKEERALFKEFSKSNDDSGLPFAIYLVLGYSYVFNMNIDVSDGLVNETIGILKYIEKRKEKKNKDEIFQQNQEVFEEEKHGQEDQSSSIILWFEFENNSIGSVLRS